MRRAPYDLRTMLEVYAAWIEDAKAEDSDAIKRAIEAALRAEHSHNPPFQPSVGSITGRSLEATRFLQSGRSRHSAHIYPRRFRSNWAWVGARGPGAREIRAVCRTLQARV
jgi:hypothetical protein